MFPWVCLCVVVQCFCVCIPLFVSLLCFLQFCVFLCSLNLLFFLDVFPPDVATCYQLPASIDHTHLVPVSQFQPVSDFLFQLFLRHLSIISCRSWHLSAALELSTGICYTCSFLFPDLFSTHLFPRWPPADTKVTVAIFMTLKFFFNIQASPDCHFQFIHLHPESKQPSSNSFSFTLKHLQRLCATFHLP